MARLRQDPIGLILLLALLCQGCQSNELIQEDDHAYAPIEVGRYWVYEVREERYTLTDAPLLSTYFLKETIGDPLTSSASGNVFRLIRSKRSRSTDAWKADSVWTVQQLPDKLIRTENNVAYSKLIFPVSNNLTWNQNEYNTLPAASYRCEQVGKAYTTGTKTYANTLRVVSQQNDSTAISLNRQADIYAYQTGLIFKETTSLAYCQSSPDCIGKGQIAYGYRRKLTLLETGKE